MALRSAERSDRPPLCRLRGVRRAAARAAVLALGAAALCPLRASAYCRSTTQGGQPDPRVCPAGGAEVAWAGGCASLSIDPRLLPANISVDQFRAEVLAAANRWSAAVCPGGASPSFHFVAYPDCPHRAEWNPSGPNANTVSFRPTWSDDAFHPPEAVAVTITTFNPDTGELRDADTEINLAGPTNPNGFTFTLDPNDRSAADLPTILTHELGHSHGLAHSMVDTAVMWFNAGQSGPRRALTADDTAGICAIYPPGRSAACNPEPPRGFQCAPPGCSCRAPGRAAPGQRSSLGVILTLASGAALGLRARRRRR
jgi:hypothetical protein